MDDASTALLLDDDNPWPGLAAYNEASQRFFHGREEISAELLRLIRLAPFVALYGKSGLGKSSMLNAGLFPKLRAARFLPVHLRLDYSERAAQLPLAQAALRLRQEIDAAGADASPLSEGESLWAYLQRQERPIWTADNYPLTPVLVFDQFEEVFSHGGSTEHVNATLNSLADLVGDRLTAELVEDRDAGRRLNLQSQQYRVVLSFRSDFLADVESWEKQANLPKRESLHLKAMSRERAIEAVARAGASVLEPGVAAQIVDFILDRDSIAASEQAAEVEPVLLSLCCYQLNSRRERPARINGALLQSAGEDILEDFYHDALKGMGPKVSVFIEENLIQGGRYRSSYPRDEALSSGDLTPEELDTLMQRRLLRIEPQGDVPRIELIHDRLVSVVRAERDARLAREQQQRQHEEAERRAHAERERERAEQAEREQARMTHSRNVLAGLSILLVVAVLSLIYFARDSYQERDQAVLASRRAEALRLMVKSQAMLSSASGDSDVRAFQQLLAARQLQLGSEIEGSMLDALMARRHLRRFMPVVVTDPSNMLAVAFSPDGQLIASGHEDGSVALRTPDNPQKVLARARRHTDIVQLVSFSDDGRQLLSSSDDGTVRQWRVDGGLAPLGEPLRAHAGHAYGIAYNHDATLIVSGHDDGTVRLWNASSGQPVREPAQLNAGPVWGVAFSRDGGSIAVATGSRKDNSTQVAASVSNLIMLDAATLREKFPPMYAHAESTYALAFSPSGHYIVTGGKDGTLRVRNLDNKAQSVRIGGHRAPVQSVAFSPDGHIIASGSQDGSVRLWLAANGEPLALPENHHVGGVTSVAFSPDGSWLASGGEDKTLLLWSLDRSWAAPDGQLDFKQGLPGRVPPPKIESVAISADGMQTVYGRSDGSLLLRSRKLPSGQILIDERGASWPSRASCDKAAPDSRAKRGSAGRRGIEQSASPSVPNPQAASSVTFSADGRGIFSGHRDGSLHRWDAGTGNPVGTPIIASNCPVTALAWSADGQYLAAASDKHVLLFDITRGALLRKLPLNQHGTVSALALSDDRNWLAIAGSDATLFLRGTQEDVGAETRVPGLPDVVHSLAFSPDGEYVVSGDAGGAVQLWNRSGRPLGRALDAYRGSVLALAFMTDGLRFLSSDRSGVIRAWPAPQTWPGLMCAKLVSNLSRKAWGETVLGDIEYRCQCPGLPISPDDPASKRPPEMCQSAG
ncbi:MAG: hypothetical protein IH606_11765 [Burkholderiales bacterium]|nr:hypothetical protein [Burkholderiales bacterium]